jgi:hypothetical protein
MALCEGTDAAKRDILHMYSMDAVYRVRFKSIDEPAYICISLSMMIRNIYFGMYANNLIMRIGWYVQDFLNSSFKDA